MPTLTTYQFDPSGQLPANKVNNEVHLLTNVSFRDYHFIVPKFGPFFADSLVVTFKSTNNEVRQLVKNIDYYPTHWFIGASRGVAKPVFGSISFLNLSLVGTITISYQTIGGEWLIDSTQIAEILADRLRNPRVTAWEQVANPPRLFPVIDHQWNMVDMVGMSSVVEKLTSIDAAIRERNATSSYTRQEVDMLIENTVAEAVAQARKTDIDEDVLYFLGKS